MPRKSHKNQKYSKELKQNAVQDYLSGKGSLRQISKKYGLLDNRQLSGAGTNMPTGILNDEGGAETGITAASATAITFFYFKFYHAIYKTPRYF